MDLCLTKEQATLKDMARTFAENELHQRAAHMDAQGVYDPALLQMLGSMGFLSLNVPPLTAAQV